MGERRAALWTLISIFVVFKLGTTAAILAASPQMREASLGLFVAFHWPFALAGIIFGVAPLLFWIRLVRVRSKRAKLLAGEWTVASAQRTSDV